MSPKAVNQLSLQGTLSDVNLFFSDYSKTNLQKVLFLSTLFFFYTTILVWFGLVFYYIQYLFKKNFRATNGRTQCLFISHKSVKGMMFF